MSERSQLPKLPGGITPWLGAGLVLSLAINAFFVGIVVGGKGAADRWDIRLADQLGMEARHGPPGRIGGAPDLDPRSFARMLPDSAREDARAIIEVRGPEIREHFRAAMEARLATFEAMRADPFDRDALVQSLAASREADAVAETAVHSLVVEIVAGLSPEERAQIGEDLGDRFPEYHERHQRRDRLRRH